VTAAIRPQEWLHFIDQEYLSTFILEGGSAIKFAVPLDDSVRHDLFDGLANISLRSGYLVVKINASETKVNMIDEIFFRTALQVPWRVLSRKIIANLAAESGYSWIDDADGPLYQRLADHNQVDPQMLLLDLKKSIGDKVFKKRNLSRDFRVAMTHLCIAELSGGQDGSTTTCILTDWLTGQNKAVSAVKPYQIFRKISRHTARYFFESMIHWVRFAGYPGTVILLDAKRVMLPKNPHDQNLFYSKAVVLDTYEVLRQFIDSADQLEGCLITVVPDITFLEDDSRGIGAYEALKFRVFDEIRDKSLVNPMASLARITAQGGDHNGN
jgi:hypothetical protein